MLSKHPLEPVNAQAIALSQRSPIVQSAYEFLISQAKSLKGDLLRKETLDALSNPQTCIEHRSGVDAARKKVLLAELLAQGLVNPADDATFPGGLLAGVFPLVLDDGLRCPKLPQTFYSAPGSVFGGHHSYPGGLPVHEANNDISDVDLAHQYRSVYGHTSEGFATINREVFEIPVNRPGQSAVFIDQDIIVAAPLWHDWAKPIVFQWNADGSEFQELNFGGNGQTDNFGAPGDSRTGGHHMLGIAEAMKRGLSPAFVITVACAHSAPTSGNEYKVVNWLRAAAILAQIDPVKSGYLTMDSKGALRLPPIRRLGDINLPSQGQLNLLAEYTLHNLSDADFTYSGPAVGEAQVVLQTLAPKYGYDPSKVSVYNNQFRNPALSFLTGERLLMIYSKKGLAGVRAELDRLRAQGIL